MRKLFGTDGVRGKANVPPMTVDTAVKLGEATAVALRRGFHRNRIVIGKDTRVSGDMFETAIAAGVCSMGADVLLAGCLPTPAISFITQSMRADAGIVISASHNPYEDNGIKIFGGDGFKLPDETELRIEQLVFENGDGQLRPEAEHVGRAIRIDDATGRYIVFAKSQFPRELTLEGLKIVVDCANGAAWQAAPAIFEELGAEVIRMADRPNGVNINDRCGAVAPEAMCARVRETGADLGIALDGDADRLILADETGHMVDGDHILAICGVDMHSRGELPGATVVATVMSNFGLEKSLARHGVRLVRTQVGDRYVVEAMRAGGYALGGEQSGHICLLNSTTTGDGCIAALQIMAVIRRTGKKVSELAKVMEVVPQTLLNIKVREKRPLDDMPPVRKAIDRAAGELGADGRVLVRYSGTENKVRIMVEGGDPARIEVLAKDIASAISQNIGV